VIRAALRGLITGLTKGAIAKQDEVEPAAPAHQSAESPPAPVHVHPGVGPLLEAMGIAASALLPPESGEAIVRLPSGDGYWRIEYVPGRDGQVDHLIARRRDTGSPIARLVTGDGMLVLDVVDGMLPDLLVTALPGRRLGDLIGVDGTAADLIIDTTDRRVFTQEQVLRVTTKTAAYVPAGPHEERHRTT